MISCFEAFAFTFALWRYIPVSDDGGSTAEIIRVLGGPAVGDVRSRCLRLSDESTAEARAVGGCTSSRIQYPQLASAWFPTLEPKP